MLNLVQDLLNAKQWLEQDLGNVFELLLGPNSS
jgi:hypothetical protein